MRILLAEDEKALSKAIVKIFEKNNYSTDALPGRTFRSFPGLRRAKRCITGMPTALNTRLHRGNKAI
jgi:hypothetical protein